MTPVQVALTSVNRSGAVPPPELSCLPEDCTLETLVEMARTAATAEAELIAPYVSTSREPPEAVSQRCTVGEHDAVVVHRCHTPQCPRAVCPDHWVGVLGRNPQLPANLWTCAECAECEADGNDSLDAGDSSEDEADALPASRAHRAPAAKRAPISCDNFLNLDEHIANVASTQRRLLDDMYSALDLAPDETPYQRYLRISHKRMKTRFPHLLWCPLAPLEPAARRTVMPNTNTPIRTLLFVFNPKLKESRDRMKRVTGSKAKQKPVTITGCCQQVWNGRAPLIECEACRAWHHFACEGLSEADEDIQFYCKKCQRERLARPPTPPHPSKRVRLNPQTEAREPATTTRTRTVKPPVKTNL